MKMISITFIDDLLLMEPESISPLHRIIKSSKGILLLILIRLKNTYIFITIIAIIS